MNQSTPPEPTQERPTLTPEQVAQYLTAVGMTRDDYSYATLIEHDRALRAERDDYKAKWEAGLDRFDTINTLRVQAEMERDAALARVTVLSEAFTNAMVVVHYYHSTKQHTVEGESDPEMWKVCTKDTCTNARILLKSLTVRQSASGDTEQEKGT